MSMELVEFRSNNEISPKEIAMCCFFILIFFIYTLLPNTNEYYFDDDSDDDDDEYDDIIHKEDFKRITRSQTRMKTNI